MNKSKLGFWIVNAGVCLLSAAAFALETPFDKMQLKGRTDKENPVAYKVGEPIVFTLRTDGLDAVPTNDRYRVRWERTGDDGKVEKGESRLVVGETCVVTTRLECAGFVRLQAHVVAGGGYWVQRGGPAPGSEGWENDKSVFFDGGAGADIDKIALEKPEPKDFDAYWAKQKAELKKVPVKADVKEVCSTAEKKIYAVTVDCAGPRPVTGYLMVPADAKAKSCVARIHFQGYGTGVQQPPYWPAQKGEIFFDVNAHGYDLGRDRGYYKDFFSKIAPKGQQYAFSKEENADPDTAYFHGMALRVMRALEFMKTRVEWNGKDLIVEGGSQGGLQTSWAAGLDKDVTLARPFITWGCNWGFVDGKRIRGPWHIPWAQGLGYYDAVSHIARVKCPVDISRAGLGDYTCPPSGLALFYNVIKAPKSITWVQGSRHGHTPVGDNQVYVEKSAKRMP